MAINAAQVDGSQVEVKHSAGAVDDDQLLESHDRSVAELLAQRIRVDRAVGEVEHDSLRLPFLDLLLDLVGDVAWDAAPGCVVVEYAALDQVIRSLAAGRDRVLLDAVAEPGKQGGGLVLPRQPTASLGVNILANAGWMAARRRMGVRLARGVGTTLEDLLPPVVGVAVDGGPVAAGGAGVLDVEVGGRGLAGAGAGLARREGLVLAAAGGQRAEVDGCGVVDGVDLGLDAGRDDDGRRGTRDRSQGVGPDAGRARVRCRPSRAGSGRLEAGSAGRLAGAGTRRLGT